MPLIRPLPSPIRILLIDDQDTYREAMAEALPARMDAEIVGHSTNGAAVERARTCHPNVVILGTTSPGIQGADLVRRLLAAAPESRVLVLSALEETGAVYHVLKAGATGYLTTQTSLPDLIAAIQKIAAGGRVISPRLVDLMLFDSKANDLFHSALTERELQVLCAFASGQSIKQIAGTINLSTKTVSTHKTRLMQKLRLKNNADLVRYALECELV